jgi:hypothetical protein
VCFCLALLPTLVRSNSCPTVVASTQPRPTAHGPAAPCVAKSPRLHIPPLRFDTTFHCALILLFSAQESSGDWWWRARAFPSVEAAAVSAGAEDLLHAGEMAASAGTRSAFRSKKFNPKSSQVRGSHPCKERKSGAPSVVVVSEELKGRPLVRCNPGLEIS